MRGRDVLASPGIAAARSERHRASPPLLPEPSRRRRSLRRGRAVAGSLPRPPRAARGGSDRQHPPAPATSTAPGTRPPPRARSPARAYGCRPGVATAMAAAAPEDEQAKGRGRGEKNRVRRTPRPSPCRSPSPSPSPMTATRWRRQRTAQARLQSLSSMLQGTRETAVVACDITEGIGKTFQLLVQSSLGSNAQVNWGWYWCFYWWSNCTWLLACIGAFYSYLVHQYCVACTSRSTMIPQCKQPQANYIGASTGR